MGDQERTKARKQLIVNHGTRKFGIEQVFILELWRLTCAPKYLHISDC